ncbi:MAG TPA: methyltransferase domain-containing protein [Falsiroseomonas sp.]|jgi:SAM-dependent methyltransferase|nr:methyltransferase domain-containing protein [Falsiroseomonas sp.]
MSFPHDDKAWADTADFLRARLAPAERMVAPDPFRFAFPSAIRFSQTRGEPPKGFDWVVVHKGELSRVPRPFLLALATATVPVFANEVFVVFSAAPPGDLTDLTESDHVRALMAGVEALPPDLAPAPASFAGGGAVTSVRVPSGEAAAPVVRAPRSPRPAREPGEAPPRPWLAAANASGGVPGMLRERAFQEELDRLVADYFGDGAGLSVLDIGCGGGRLAPALTAAVQLVGVDIAAAPLARARARHATLPGFAFARMDAARLGFPEASFDAALMLDTLDALPDPAAALAEAARVLARGGRLMVTATNKDSLPLRALRRLALTVPAGGVSVQELAGMLRAAGLTPTRMDGIFLSLGWAMPGAGGALGPLEEDPEFVEAARVLGRRCGPDHALAICMMARKG